jgi:asparagine synthase (glutamine-hydrolysing)
VTTGHSLLLERQGREWRVTGATSAFLGRRHNEVDSAAEGTWAEWAWEDGSLQFRNDRFGFYPVFYFFDNDRHGISTSIIDLLELGAPPELDDDALAVFLRLGTFLADDTPFRSIRAAPPGCDIAGPPDATRWRPGAHRDGPRAELSRAEATSRYGDLFQEAVEKLPLAQDDTVAVPLSGGRDSRHILFALARAGRLPRSCITMKHYPPKSNEDAAIAAQVAKAVGVPHVLLDPPPRVIRAERTKNRMTHFCASEHTWILPLADYARTTGVTVLLDGVAGDVLSAGLFLTEERLKLYESGRLRELAEALLGGEGYLPKLLPAALYGRWTRERAIRRLETELARHVGAPNPVGQFYFWNRTRRQIALSPWSILARDCTVMAPYLDHQLYDFLYGLPASFLLDHAFHTEAIRQFYPEFADIPYETKSFRVRSTRSRVAALALSATAFAGSPSTDMSYVRRSFILPRIAKALVNLEFGTHLRQMLNTPVYLSQLAGLRRQLPHRG